jgi:very-short-patch-repair endonuclease
MLSYNPKLKQTTRKLRKQRILSEVILWKELKGKKILGFDFHRQIPIDNYIVDFFCSELKLAIEIDGESHNYKYEDDLIRQKKLEERGITFLRFYDGHVKQYTSQVIDEIKKWLMDHQIEHTPSR